VDGHWRHASGSPPLAVAWQSAATDAGFPQLALQNVRRSSQLVSGGGGGAPVSVSVVGVAVAVAVGAPAVQPPRVTHSS